MHVNVISPAQTEQAAESKEPLRVKDIAAALRVDSSTVYAEIKSGRLASYRVGTGRGTIRIARTAFAGYLAERGIPTEELAVSL
jgi:excisionase family DNA binding protein